MPDDDDKIRNIISEVLKQEAASKWLDFDDDGDKDDDDDDDDDDESDEEHGLISTEEEDEGEGEQQPVSSCKYHSKNSVLSVDTNQKEIETRKAKHGRLVDSMCRKDASNKTLSLYGNCTNVILIYWYFKV